MSLSPPAPRRPKHTRRITCEGFLRDDGLWDIEARIVDTKAYRYVELDRGVRSPGDPVHDMMVRLTLDEAKVVRGIEVAFLSNPYPRCLGAAPNFQGLVGAQVGPGWRKAVQAQVGGTRGCTHVRELLLAMATVAYQTMSGWASEDEARQPQPPAADDHKPHFVDGCHAWDVTGEVVARFYPRYHQPVQAK